MDTAAKQAQRERERQARIKASNAAISDYTRREMEMRARQDAEAAKRRNAMSNQANQGRKR